MSPNRSFTAAVVRHLLSDPETPEIVSAWFLAEPDTDRRVVGYAANLAEDVRAVLLAGEGPQTPERALRNELLRLALARVNWRCVARALLRYYTFPILAAARVTDRRDRARFTWSAWNGPVN